MKSPIREIRLNNPQLQFVLSKPSDGVNIWSRATGKSTIIAWLLKMIIELMPRSSWSIVGQNYKQMMTRTLPSTVSGLQMLGLEMYDPVTKRGHFIVRQKPPSHWPRPFEPPLHYENYISTYSGAGFHLVSLESQARGLNVDGIIADESLTLNKNRFDMGIKTANRGNIRYFGHVWFHHGIFHFSSMPYGKARWLLDYSKYYEFDFRTIRRKIAQVQLQIVDSSDMEERLQLFREMERLKKQLHFHKSKEGLLYLEADIFDNLHNIGFKYLIEQRRDLADFIFMVEVLNYFPDHIENGFYPLLNEDFHGYRNAVQESYLASMDTDDDRLKEPDCRMDSDCIPGSPLHIAVDWGSKINSMCIGQHTKTINELSFLKNIYVKHPKILDNLALEFVRYYQPHGTKKVYFAYDPAGNAKMANSDLTFSEQFAKILKAHKWDVVFLSNRMANVGHSEKYLLWNKVLKENDPAYPRIRFNLDNCGETFISMANAPARESSKGLIEKVKSSERNPFIPQEEATHLSDAADILLGSVTALDGMTHRFTDVMYS